MKNVAANLQEKFLDENGNIAISWQQFFSSIGYEKKLWTPVFTGLTGSPTVLAQRIKYGEFCRVYITLTGATSATAATSTIPYPSDGFGSCEFWNTGANMKIGDGLISGTNLSFPNWSGIANVAIFGTYVIGG